MITKMKKGMIAFLAIVATMFPIVSAYSDGPLSSMMNLWDVFVEQIFGAFWPAVFFIALIFLIILMLGGISFYTVIIFEVYFLAAMAIGYGYLFVVFPVIAGSVIYMLWQGFKMFLENR